MGQSSETAEGDVLKWTQKLLAYSFRAGSSYHSSLSFMHNFVTLWLVVLPCLLMSQDYQLMVPGRTYLFAHHGNRAISLDSVEKTSTGYRYHNYQTVVDCSWDTFPLGPRVMQVPLLYDTLNLRYTWQNAAGNSLAWELNTQPGTSWHMTPYRDTLWLTVQHDSTSWHSVLGTMDSVRHYHLAVRNEQGSLISDTLNGRTIRLSQSHGFLDAFSYDDFPQNGDLFPLEGVSNPDLGRQALTKWDFYDMPVGGEIHYEEVKKWDGILPYEGLSEFDRRIRWQILERGEAPGRLQLTIDQTQGGRDFFGDVEEDDQGIPRFRGIDTLYIYRRDTISIVITDSSINHVLPYSLVPEWSIVHPYSFRVNGQFDPYYGTNSSGDWLGITDWVSDIPEVNGICWQGFTDYNSLEFSIKGLGDFLYSWGGWEVSQWLIPIYYRFPADSVGTPVDFEALRQEWLTSVEGLIPPRLSLFPNPFRQQLFLQGQIPIGAALILRLYDLQGRQIWQASIEGNAWTVPELPTGLFLAEIWQGGRLLGRERVRRE